MNQFDNIQSGKGMLKDQFSEDNAISDALRKKRIRSYKDFDNLIKDKTEGVDYGTGLINIKAGLG